MSRLSCVKKQHVRAGQAKVHVPMQRLKLYISSVHYISWAPGRKGSCHASSVTSDALHPMSNLHLLSPSVLLYWSVIDSAEGVWNVSVIIFGAFFCNKREAQTVTQSVWWVGAHAEIQTAQTGRQSNGWWRLLAEKIIWSTDTEIKTGQDRTKNIFVLLTYDALGNTAFNPDGKVLSPLSV